MLDHGDDVGGGLARAVVRSTGPVEQPGLPVFSVAVDPCGQSSAGDAGLGGDMGDRAVLAASHESSACFEAQGSITVGAGSLLGMVVS